MEQETELHMNAEAGAVPELHIDAEAGGAGVELSSEVNVSSHLTSSNLP